MGYSICVESYFSSAHRLRGYRGKCETLHGHNWRVQAVVAGKKLDKTGMLCDFKEAKSILGRVLEALDHKDLNKIAPFDKINPTSERIAEHIFFKIEKKLRPGLGLKSITVWETPASSATFTKDP